MYLCTLGRYAKDSEWSEASGPIKALPAVLLTSSVCVSALTVSRDMGIGTATAGSPFSSSLAQMRILLV